ncbi:hypothetical protein Xen7305DRAFT_00051070 [Xenococcus sp. PCC 7305]|uniref:hypothetical protein n=1 Tax=Xenococcus sp. PCC 7305 TaxID=102125 RepID=UPI0002ABCCC7|nr:hypothetical protein [Xenococcus sp. PCC 7305]ELS05364.1 hypothetical protein Xen7305DRAFT_00051070 [Xenococcus sp. PCC 7305]
MPSNESISNSNNHLENQENSAAAKSDREISQILTEVGQSLEELRTRYLQVEQDWQRHAELVKHKQELEQKKASNFEREPIKTELKDIEQQISELEINLESVLLPDLFWQAVRFGGLGIAIGWLLKSIAG